MSGLGITGVDHVGIAVADLDSALDFYREKFGFEVEHLETNEEQGVTEAMVRVGQIAKFLDRSGPGIQQLAYRVVDINAACAAATAKGMRLLFAEPKRGTANSKINFIHPKDAGGVLVELVEPASSH
jgi:methylmalonyl-CoA/ethylmalonyl-CoA epimerase